MRRVIPLTLIVLGVLAICAHFVLPHTRIASKEERASAAYWQERIAAVGPASAYQELTRSLKDQSPDEQHGDAHIFGSALYAAAGVDGMRICDSQFSYGCYHELVGEAIASQGVTVLAELEKGCDDKTGCEHGIGHGLVGALGYTKDALGKAIDTCDAMVPGGIDGCKGGAFMEYNMRTLAETSRTVGVSRPLDTTGLLAPCLWFSGSAQESCTLLQPQWWSTVIGDTDALEKESVHMGTLCRQYASSESVRSCFEGMGWIIAALTHYDAPTAASLCDSSSEDLYQRLGCRSFVAQLFFALGLPVAQGEEACAGLTLQARDFCMAFAHGAANASRQPPWPTRS